jgi:hypothetical protein
MYFILNRSDRSGSILQIMLYIYAYCCYHNISYDGLISNNSVWWYNMNFFNHVHKIFYIKNSRIDISTLNKITFDQVNSYANKQSQGVCVEFIVADLCSYFSNNINKYINNDFKKQMNISLEKHKIVTPNKIIISVHIRRGDVNSNISKRYTNDKTYINIIDTIIKTINTHDYEVHIFSEKQFNGNISLYEKYKDKLHLHLASNNDVDQIMKDLIFMIYSDHLICSKSSFSYLPALLNTTGRIYHNNKFWNKPLNSFNVYDDDTGLIFQ